jgi:hypothetical protein
MQPLVITSGIASEYVLGGVAADLRQRGLEVQEFDFGTFAGDARSSLSELRHRDCVYITSAHTNLTRRVASVIAPFLLQRYPHYLSPLEFMAILKPRMSLYVPHDLLSPFGDSHLDEFRFLDLFDHILAPTADPILQSRVGRHTRVHAAGWIKFRAGGLPADSAPRSAALRTGASSQPRITFFISFVEHLMTKYGPSGIVEYFRPILTENVSVKLPLWQGVEEVERALRDQTPARVVPAECLSTELILRSDLVLCNGASSIQAESILLGVPAICLLDSEAEPRETKVRKLVQLPNLLFHDYETREPLPPELVQQALASGLPRRLKPFDPELVFSLISAQA